VRSKEKVGRSVTYVKNYIWTCGIRGVYGPFGQGKGLRSTDDHVGDQAFISGRVGRARRHKASKEIDSSFDSSLYHAMTLSSGGKKGEMISQPLSVTATSSSAAT
jgi:hypothetical protein